MRLSRLLTTTLREVPRDTEGGNQELLVRGGYIRQLTSGIYSMLPLGNRVIRKISQIIREEMDRAGGQEVTMPVLQPKDLWDKEPVGGGGVRAQLPRSATNDLPDSDEAARRAASSWGAVTRARVHHEGPVQLRCRLRRHGCQLSQ